MPNLIGKQYQDALAAMVAAGVRVLPLGYFQVDPVTVSWITTHGVSPGFIVGQVPQPEQAIAANSAVVLTISGYPMAVSTDGPVVSPEIEGDALYDDPGSVFILDESTLK